MKDKYFLILREIDGHPNSVLKRMLEMFDKPSIVYATSNTKYSSYKVKPVLSDKYLMIFTSKKTLEEGCVLLSLDTVFPVFLCSTESQEQEAINLFNAKSIPYRRIHNEFKKEDVADLILEFTDNEASQSFIDALRRRVGMSPTRLYSALNVLKEVGYTTSNVTKYIDKYVYTSTYDIICVLAGRKSSKAQYHRVVLYLQQHQHGYSNYVKPVLIKELELMVKVFTDIREGRLNEHALSEYLVQNAIPRWKVLRILDLYEEISIVHLLNLKSAVENSTILDIIVSLIKSE